MKTLAHLLIVFVFLTSVGAQTFTGGISGSVTDASNAAVVGAHVVATRTGTNEQRESSTDESGSFTFTALQPGGYVVEASQAGFKKAVQSIELRVQQFVKLDFVLQVGQANEVVEVKGQAQLLDCLLYTSPSPRD